MRNKTLFHVAQDFSDEVVTLETAWRAASHGTIVGGIKGTLRVKRELRSQKSGARIQNPRVFFRCRLL